MVIDQQERQQVVVVIGCWELYDPDSSRSQCLDLVVHNPYIISNDHKVHILTAISWHFANNCHYIMWS